MIGLLQPDRGQVWVGGVEISRLRGRALNEVRKRFAMLFQGAALFDSLTVFENVAFPLREKLRMKGADVSRRVDEKLEQVGLAGMGHKFPAELSGGMKKRAGLARLGTHALDRLPAEARHSIAQRIALALELGVAVRVGLGDGDPELTGSLQLGVAGRPIDRVRAGGHGALTVGGVHVSCLSCAKRRKLGCCLLSKPSYNI